MYNSYSLCFCFIEIVCGDPGTPSNGMKIGSEFTFGKSVSFECNAGYALRGSLKRTCKSDGTWDGVQPTCNGELIAFYSIHKQLPKFKIISSIHFIEYLIFCKRILPCVQGRRYGGFRDAMPSQGLQIIELLGRSEIFSCLLGRFKHKEGGRSKIQSQMT